MSIKTSINRLEKLVRRSRGTSIRVGIPTGDTITLHRPGEPPRVLSLADYREHLTKARTSGSRVVTPTGDDAY